MVHHSSYRLVVLIFWKHERFIYYNNLSIKSYKVVYNYIELHCVTKTWPFNCLDGICSTRHYLSSLCWCNFIIFPYINKVDPFLLQKKKKKNPKTWPLHSQKKPWPLTLYKSLYCINLFNTNNFSIYLKYWSCNVSKILIM